MKASRMLSIDRIMELVLYTECQRFKLHIALVTVRLTTWHICSDSGQVTYMRWVRPTQPFILNWWMSTAQLWLE